MNQRKTGNWFFNELEFKKVVKHFADNHSYRYFAEETCGAISHPKAWRIANMENTGISVEDFLTICFVMDEHPVRFLVDMDS